MIDLHSHTTESDGTVPPVNLIAAAHRAGVTTLAITDHDTFTGYDQAVAAAREAGITLLCGIELSTKLRGRPAHLLGYFQRGPSAEFRAWVTALQMSRRDRNVRLVARLRELGLDITLEEVQARGRSMTGRPHFAQVLVEKGYVASLQQAFDEYLDESAKGYVDRNEPTLAEAAARIAAAGGVASLAHPIRIAGDLEPLLPELRRAGLGALEAYHSDHLPEHTAAFLGLAERHQLRVTGGSDFHGATKPGIELGTGRSGNLRIPPDLVARLFA